MAQIGTGLRGLLSHAAIYDFVQRAIGVERLYRRISADDLRLEAGSRLLDIGCGPASILDVLPPDVSYDGFDASDSYIRSARRRYGGRGRFWVARVNEAAVAELPPFDAVLAFAVLHHLDDIEAAQLIDLAWEALKPGGRFVTYDPCFADGQGRVSRFLVERDRGRNVRSPERYATLASRRFDRVEREVLDGHLRVPYTAVILRSSKPSVPPRGVLSGPSDAPG